MASRFATGIAVITATTPEGTPHGVTVNSFTSVSCKPPIVSVCLGLECSILAAIATARYFAINVLSDSQRQVSVRFAQSCDARFEGIAWTRGETGVPILSGVLASFECRAISRLDVGDHLILLGEVQRAEAFDGEPLVYFSSRYRQLETLRNQM